MHKSFSTTRQETYATGLGRVDTQGNIVRGDIELPVVPESSNGHSPSEKIHDDSGVYSQSPVSKEETPSAEDATLNFGQSGLTSDTTGDGRDNLNQTGGGGQQFQFENGGPQSNSQGGQTIEQTDGGQHLSGGEGGYQGSVQNRDNLGHSEEQHLQSQNDTKKTEGELAYIPEGIPFSFIQNDRTRGPAAVGRHQAGGFVNFIENQEALLRAEREAQGSRSSAEHRNTSEHSEEERQRSAEEGSSNFPHSREGSERTGGEESSSNNKGSPREVRSRESSGELRRRLSPSEATPRTLGVAIVPYQEASEKDTGEARPVDSSRYVDHSKVSPRGVNPYRKERSSSNHSESASGGRFRRVRSRSPVELCDGDRTPTDTVHILNYYETPGGKNAVQYYTPREFSGAPPQSFYRKDSKKRAGKELSSSPRSFKPRPSPKPKGGKQVQTLPKAKRPSQIPVKGNAPGFARNAPDFARSAPGFASNASSKSEDSRGKQAARNAALARVRAKRTLQYQQDSDSDPETHQRTSSPRERALLHIEQQRQEPEHQPRLQRQPQQEERFHAREPRHRQRRSSLNTVEERSTDGHSTPGASASELAGPWQDQQGSTPPHQRHPTPQPPPQPPQQRKHSPAQQNRVSPPPPHEHRRRTSTPPSTPTLLHQPRPPPTPPPQKHHHQQLPQERLQQASNQSEQPPTTEAVQHPTAIKPEQELATGKVEQHQPPAQKQEYQLPKRTLAQEQPIQKQEYPLLTQKQESPQLSKQSQEHQIPTQAPVYQQPTQNQEYQLPPPTQLPQQGQHEKLTADLRQNPPRPTDSSTKESETAESSPYNAGSQPRHIHQDFVQQSPQLDPLVLSANVVSSAAPPQDHLLRTTQVFSSSPEKAESLKDKEETPGLVNPTPGPKEGSRAEESSIPGNTGEILSALLQKAETLNGRGRSQGGTGSDPQYTGQASVGFPEETNTVKTNENSQGTGALSDPKGVSSSALPSKSETLAEGDNNQGTAVSGHTGEWVASALLNPQGAGVHTDTSQSKPQPNMSTATEGPRAGGGGGGGDRLSEVTLERDQLLRNERTYKQRILQLEEEVKSVVRQSQDLSSENKHLRMKLEAFETKAYGGSLEVKELRREKQDLIAMVSKTTAEKQQADTENERLKTRLAELDSKSKQWDALYVDNNKLKTKQAELEKRIGDLDLEKQGLQNRLKTAESSQQEKVVAVQNENKKLQAELINLQTKNNALEKKVQRLETENTELTDRLDKKREELDEMMRAMKAETNIDMELKETKTELEFAMNKIQDYKKELDEVKHRYEVLEKETDSAKNALRLKESELKGVKANSEEKDTQIGELKRQADAGKRNVKRLENDLEDTKQVEKDSVNMKARIRSLKNEIEDSLAANHKIKQERTEARMETETLNREMAVMTENMDEAKRYIKKLEGERVGRDKVEDELTVRKKREHDLEGQLLDANARNEQLRLKMREMDEERQELLKKGGGVGEEVQAVNKKLQDDNHKLRQMLVERNMEITQRQSERNQIMNRVDSLERKQHDSDIKVQQLKGWVEGVQTYTVVQDPALLQPKSYNPVVTLPPVASPTGRSPFGAGQKGRAAAGAAAGAAGAGKKKKNQQRLQQRQHHLNRSWEDLTLSRLRAEEQESVRTTPSLPIVLDSKIINTPGIQGAPSYYELYKNKMKVVRERKW